MDNPWGFPAGAGADLCPVCSARHFPFCPPPPLPPQPFPYDLHPPPPPPPPQYHAPFHPPPPPPMWGPQGPHPYELLDREGPHKRMRVGDAPPFGPYAAALPPPLLMPGRASVEGERLLGLIRDHGRPPRPPSPPTPWHGEPYPPDGFGFGGAKGYPSSNYNNPYAQGGNFVNHDHAGRMPPPPPPHDRHSAFSSGFVPAGGSQEKYFDRDNRYHQFHPEASPGALPLPPLPQYAEAISHYDSRDWHLEAGVVPPPPEPPVPSPPDYNAMPPLPAANSSLFPIFFSSPATTALLPSAHTLHQAHSMTNANCYNEPIHNEGLGLIYRPHSEQHLGDGRPTQSKHSHNNAKINIVNACDLFKLPLRASRPDHVVIILRGLPGSFTTVVNCPIIYQVVKSIISNKVDNLYAGHNIWLFLVGEMTGLALRYYATESVQSFHKWWPYCTCCLLRVNVVFFTYMRPVHLFYLGVPDIFN